MSQRNVIEFGRTHLQFHIKTVLHTHCVREERVVGIMIYHKKYKDPNYRGGFDDKSEGICPINSFSLFQLFLG